MVAASLAASLAAQAQTATGANQAQPAARDDAIERERQLIREVADSLRTKEALAKTAATPKNWKPERTPWGDPDLSGLYTNSDETDIPFERPAEFEGSGSRTSRRRSWRSCRSSGANATIDRAGERGGGSARPSAAVLVGEPERRQQPRVARERSAGRQDPADDAGGRAAIAARAEARRRSGRGPADSWEDRSLYDRCISRGLPGSMMPAIYGSSYQIVQGPAMVAITYEMIHETRVIPLDGRAHVSKGIATYMGDARGHFEGDTLVVDTTNFKDQIAYRNANGETLRLVERFKPVTPEPSNGRLP